MTATRWRRRPDVLWRRSLDTVLLLPAPADDVLTLAGTGPAVWELLAEWRTVDDMVGILAAAHGTSPEVVAQDLAPLLVELEGQGVLQKAADSGGPGAS
jgi:Coenzyme PQQ synthesis protein D (PqqD)